MEYDPQLITSIEKDKFEFIKKLLRDPEKYDFIDEGNDHWYIYQNLSAPYSEG